jgi:hypothetical protein
MGLQWIDQYSLLHFASGVIVYFWGVRLWLWILIHSSFEYLENTEIGMKVIRDTGVWPGGKDRADSLINSLGDTIFAILGWIVAYWLDNLGKKYNWVYG